MSPGLSPFLDALRAEGCPYCGREPATVAPDGPVEFVLEPCGHRVDPAAVRRESRGPPARHRP